MKKTVVAVLFLVIFFGSLEAKAAPSFSGATGMINTPTADVLRKGDFSLGVYRAKDSLSGSIGVNPAPNLELSFLHRDYRKNSSLPDMNALNAKYSLLPESILTPGLAVGVDDMTDDTDRSWYVSTSKGLVLGFRLHAGYGNGRYDGFFAALEKSISPISIGGVGETKLILEWDSKHFNTGLRMAVAPGLNVDAGYRQHRYYVGASFVN